MVGAGVRVEASIVASVGVDGRVGVGASGSSSGGVSGKFTARVRKQ